MVAVASVLAALIAAYAFGAQGAAAKVVEAEGAQIGMTPRIGGENIFQPSGSSLSFANPEGRPVMHSSATYAIYWDPTHAYSGDWQHLIDTFLHRVGGESGSLANVFGVDSQYTDKSGQRAAYKTVFHGAYTDTAPYPESGCTDPDTLGEEYPDGEAKFDNIACLSDAQLREALQGFIAANRLPTGMGTMYFLLTPPGVTVCAGAGGELTSSCSDTLSEQGFCSYHSAISPANPIEGSASTILYAAIPWTAGGLGDYHLTDRRSGVECQDSGFDPSAKGGETYEPKKATPEAVHQQEPNQLPAGQRSSDGTFDAGLADLIVNQVAIEQQNAMTNPLLDAWQDSAGNEAIDECRNTFGLTSGGSVTAQEDTGAGTLFNQKIGGGSYYLNDAFDLAALKQIFPGVPCVPGANLQPQFTAPDVVNAGEIVGFDASESDVTLDVGQGYTGAGVPYQTYPTYEWSFGDGSSVTPPYPVGASPVDEPAAFHSYVYGGTYDVTLKITDTGGNVASLTQPITVVGPPPPPPPPPPVPPLGGGTKSGSTSTTSSTSTSKPPLPRPVATAIVTTGSLTEALRRGLPVRYSVNQQVAGHFEVLLPSRLAKRLHIKGRTASGLAAGTPPQTVIAYALLVTMHKAHGTLRIEIPQPANARLGHLHKVTLTLRLVVRNAARSKPKLTLLQTVVKLRR
jgi:PKD domain